MSREQHFKKMETVIRNKNNWVNLVDVWVSLLGRIIIHFLKRMILCSCVPAFTRTLNVDENLHINQNINTNLRLSHY